MNAERCVGSAVCLETMRQDGGGKWDGDFDGDSRKWDIDVDTWYDFLPRHNSSNCSLFYLVSTYVVLLVAFLILHHSS